MNGDDHARWLRLQAIPDRRKQPAQIAWEQGYRAGWDNGRTASLVRDEHDLVGPVRWLHQLRGWLAMNTVQGQPAHTIAGPSLHLLDVLVRAALDDSADWPLPETDVA